MPSERFIQTISEIHLRRNGIYPDLVAHREPKDLEVVRGGHEPRVLVRRRKHNRRRARRDAVEQRAGGGRELREEDGEEGDEHRRQCRYDKEGLYDYELPVVGVCCKKAELTAYFTLPKALSTGMQALYRSSSVKSRSVELAHAT